MLQGPDDRAVVAETIVAAPLGQVWEAWTTAEGAATFFAPRCHIDLWPHGRYEMLFDLEAEPGKQGGEGMIVLAVQPCEMLSFTWNAPPELSGVREQMTHVMVRLHKVTGTETRVVLRHDGWGSGAEWDAAYRYFERAWKKVVLPRLKHRFESGPIDWEHPPDIM
jgi:uncharacterized protein YndB with AHSA1/START domain